MFSQIDECFKERYQKCGDTYKMTVCTGKEKMTHSWKLDVESKFGGISLTMRKDKYGSK